MKKRYYKRGLVIFFIALLVCAATALGCMAYAEFNRAEAYKRFTEARSQSAFNQLVSSMNELSSTLEKSLYCTSPSLSGAVCTQIFGKAMAAQMALGDLPFSTTELEQTASYISHVGDYSFAIARKAPTGEGYTQEEHENLRKLSETAALLSQSLRDLQAELVEGRMSMDDLYTAERKMDDIEAQENPDSESPATAGGEFRLIEQEFPEIPTLIYDGPFSDHIASLTPRLLEGESDVSENAARKAAADFLGMREGRVFLADKIEGDLPSYRFSVSLEGGDVHVAVTRRGGKILSMMSDRTPQSTDISVEDAKAKAQQFLESRGFTGMEESYYAISGSCCTFNYAYAQEGVICYADLIKVEVALDNGSIMGFEAKGYIMSHHPRQLPAVEVDAEAAKEHLTSDLSLLDEGMALIPTGGKYEILCHEFMCETENGEHLIIYVNAVTGDQEKILILIEDENGTLVL